MSGSKSYAGGFPDYKPIQRKDVDKLGMTPQITERQFMAVSTDSEGMDQTDALLFDSKLGGPSNAVVKPIQSNPMDFEYFEKVVRSDDEARQQVSWRKNPVKRRFSHSKSADPVKRVIRARGPRHEEIMETSVSQGTFACIVLATLRIACAKEIRIQNHIKKPIARTLGSSLILATFSVDCAKNLREEKQSKCLTTRENHIIYLLLIKLMATSLVEVQFTPAFDSLLQNTDLISTLLQRVVDGVSGTEAVLELLDDSTTKLNSLNESIRLCTLMLCVMKNLHRTCEKVHKKRRIQPHFIICDRLCANNGMATVGKVLELVTSQPTLEMMSGMDRLLVEVSAFIGAVGVCEVALVESPCSSKTMEQLMTFSASLMRHLLDVVQKCKTCGQDLGLANMLLDGLLSAKKQFCVHPYVAWEYLLHVAIFAEEVEELRTKSFSLLEILIGHFFTAHPEVSVSTIVRKYPQIRLCTVSSNSPTDSDSAFYASDPGEAESSAGDKSSEHNHLTLYRTLLSSSLKTVVRQTLYHLIKLTHISPWKLRLQIFVVVVLPTLEDLSLNLAEEDGLKDLKTYTVQKLFFITETLMKEREVFVYCRCKKQFLKTLLAFKVDPNLCDYAYRCAFTFLSSEIRRCLRNLSLDSFTTSTPLLSTSAEEFDLVSLFDEHVSQVVKAFSSNPTIRDALTSLETGTQNMLSDRDLEFRQLKDVCAMWRLQTSLAQVFNDYAEYLGQRKKDMSLALALVNLLLSRLNDDQDNHKLIVTTVGSIVQLFVELSNTMTRKRESEKHTARYMFLECLVSLEEFILAGTKSQSLSAENFNVVVHMLLNAGVKKESSEETKVKNVSIALQTYTVPEVKIESDAYFPEDSDEQSDNEVVKDGKKVSRAIVSKELVNLTIRLLISFAANPVVTKYDSVVIDGLSRLTEVCCGKEEKNKAILDELCANSIILAELPKILTKDNPLVQEVVLNLLINQAQFRLSRDDLHSFINFFKTNFSEGQSSDSVRIMLRGLDDIVTANSRKLQPKTFAEFPTACTKQEEDLKSARHSGATAFVLPFSTGDPLFSLTCKTEASVSLWFTMDSDFKSSSEKYHLVSLGSQMLMLEVWLDKTSIQVQIVSSVSEPEKVGSATFLLAEILDTAKKMPFERWTHLVLSCSSKSESAEIQIFLNTIGSKKLTVSLKDIAVQLQHQAKTINAEMCKQTVIVGHKTSKHEDPKYRIGKAVLVFNSFNCDENCAAALYFLGPTCGSLTKLFVPTPNQFLPSVRKRALEDCPNILKMFEVESELLESSNIYYNALTRVRLCLYAAYNLEFPDRLLVYPPKPKEDNGGGILGSLGLGSLSPKESKPFYPCQEPPVIVHKDANISVQVSALTSWKFGYTVMELGGVTTLLLLLGRVVELQLGDVEVSLALNILLTTVGSSPEVQQEFHSKDGFVLLRRILRSECCRAGIKTVQVLFRHCVTSTVIGYDKKRNMYYFNEEENACFYDVGVLKLLLFDCWKTWTRNTELIEIGRRRSCLDIVLTACSMLLSDSNVTRIANARALKCINVTKRLVYSMKAVPVNDINIAHHVVNIITGLLDSPPALHDLNALMETALLLHESSMTFVPHSKSNFFFLIGESVKERRNRKSKKKAVLIRKVNDGKDETHKDGASAKNMHFGVLKQAELSADRKRNGKTLIPEEDYYSPDQESDRAATPVGELTMEGPDPNPCQMSSGEDDSLATTTTTGSDLFDERDCNMHVHLFENPGQWGRSTPDEVDEHFDEAMENDEHALKAQMDTILDGIINCLSQALQNLPDNKVKDVASQALLPEYIIVLANHPKAKLRASAIGLLWQYINRTHAILEEHGHRLLKMEGYLLLANQLHQYQATENVVNACLSIVHNRRLILYECPEIPTHVQILILAPGLVPLLALMPNSLNEVALAHALIMHVHELCAKVQGLLRNYNSVGLFEALCKTFGALAHLKNQTTDVCGQDSREILFQDLYDFFRLIGLRFVTAHGSENLRTVDEFLHLLLFMAIEDQCEDGVQAFRQAVCVVLEECLADVQSRVSQIDAFSSKRPGSNSGFGGFYSSGQTAYPMEEVTDLLMRTVTPKESSELSPRQRRRHQTGSSMTTIARGIHGGMGAWTTKNPDDVKLATRPELVERYVYLINFSVDFFIHFNTERYGAKGPENYEEALIFSVTKLMLNDLQCYLNAGSESRNLAARALYPDRQALKTKLMSLINFCLSPELPLSIRLKMVKILCYENCSSTILKYLLNNNPTQLRLFNSFMHNFAKAMLAIDGATTDLMRNDAMEFYFNLKRWGILVKTKEEDSSETSHNETESSPDPIVDNFQSQLAANRRVYDRKSVNHIVKILSQFDELTLLVTKKALEVTEVAVRAQDEERKKMMVAIRDALSDKVRARQIWQEITELSTHERGVWFMPDSPMPQSWALCEMEGAQRMRIRLDRCHSGIPSKHYKAEHKSKGKDFIGKPSFAYLLKAPSGMSSVIIAQLSSNDRILHMEQCSLVLPSDEISGEILVSDSRIYFVQSSTDAITTVADLVSFSIHINDIREAHTRWFQLNDCAIELFMVGGHTKLLSFTDRKQRDNFKGLLLNSRPSLAATIPLERITRMWQEGQITNFDYLMHLNKLAGRTFNDLMQYPVFPFVLADYSSDILDLKNAKSFRNLKKPVSVQDPAKEQRYIETYRNLATDLQRSHEGVCPGVGPFHYGSHYSNTGVVLHFLVRLPPFSSMFLQYQDGNFDLPDRTFHSIGKAWSMVSGESSSDVKELIPDMFCLPEILTNNEGFQLGLRQNGEGIDVVDLPSYAKDDPRLFIKIHRQALEAPYVRENLNHWIDLVFGYKQTGQPAIDAINVFHPATYYGFDLNTIEDQVQRQARATMIKTYGQTPKRLFDKPHPMVSQKFITFARIQQQNHEGISVSKVVDSVDGLQWGTYIGSPSESEPIVIWKAKQDIQLSKLISVVSNEVRALLIISRVGSLY